MLQNEVLSAIAARRSCRAYQPEQIKPEELRAVLDAGTWAPTAMNRQSPVIVAVQDKATRDRLSQMNAAVMGRDGDPFYGTRGLLEETREHRLCLHAASLRITHPMTGRPLEITAPFDFPTF